MKKRCKIIVLLLVCIMILTACSSKQGKTVTITTSEYVETVNRGTGTTEQTVVTEKIDYSTTVQQSSSSSVVNSVVTESVKEETSEYTQTITESNIQNSYVKEEKEPIKNVEEAMKYSDKNIEYIGRFSHEADYSNFAWSGTKITAGFNGTKIGAILKSSSSEDYLNIYVDGKKTQKLKIGSKKELYVLAENLSSGNHTVELEKCTEGSKTTMSFYGFDYFEGKAHFAPAKKEKTIMFIGDSVTAGYGVLGTESGFRLIEENIALTYAGYTAKELNADGIYLALSGQGMAQNLGGTEKPVMKDYLLSTLPKNYQDGTDLYDIKNEKVDAIVINLGTNDFATNVNTDKFKTKYTEFITLLRGYYPDADIVCMVGPHKVGLLAESYIKQLVEEFNETDKNIHFISVSAVEGKGSDGHPSDSEQTVAGQELVAFMKKIFE